MGEDVLCEIQWWLPDDVGFGGNNQWMSLNECDLLLL